MMVVDGTVRRMGSLLALGGLLLGGFTVSSVGCGADDGFDNEEQDIQSCGGARIDEHGTCRKTNGQFAKKECCKCTDAAPDLTGTCVRSSGDLAPAACCEDLCGGAAIDDKGYCRKTNGQFALNNCCADACATLQSSGKSISDVAACKNFATECQGTSLDDHGFCRTTNGQFAKAACCNASCKDTALDANGVCRSTVTGRFAPASCCAAACDGASLGEDGRCRKTNGQFALSACCADECFASQQDGATASVPACSSCDHSECEEGAALDVQCSPCGAAVCEADAFCCEEAWDKECATKAVELCGGKCEGVLDSCQGSCGHRAPGNCWCDALCTELGDCCADKVDLCGG